jgi:hypothetical protein
MASPGRTAEDADELVTLCSLGHPATLDVPPCALFYAALPGPRSGSWKPSARM